MSVKRSSGKALVQIDAFDSKGNPINGFKAKVNVNSPSGSSQPITLEQTGSGRYTGSFDADQTGGYVITAAQGATPGAKPMITKSGYSVAYPPEYQAIGMNNSLLTQIAAITRGKVLSNPAEAFRPMETPGESARDLWQILLLAAALLFLVDIAVRRLAISGAEIAEQSYAAASKLIGNQVLGWRNNRRKTGIQVQTLSKLSKVKQHRPENGDAKEAAQRLSDAIRDEESKTPIKEKVTTEKSSAPLNSTQHLLNAKRKKDE
jgi:hypothetical protein